MWSKKPRPVYRTRLGFAVEIDRTRMSVSRVRRVTSRDARAIEHRVRDRGPGLGAAAADLVAREAEIARELDVGVAVADHRRTVAVERRGVHDSRGRGRCRLAARAAGLGRGAGR